MPVALGTGYALQGRLSADSVGVYFLPQTERSPPLLNFAGASMTSHSNHLNRFLLGVACVGLLPALVIAALLRLRGGMLFVAGHEVAEFDLLRLFAAQASILEPVYLILPLALALQELDRLRFLVAAALSSALLFGPSLVAGVLVGGDRWAPPALALGLYCLVQLNLALWVRTLAAGFGFRFAALIYAAIWAVSDYVNYLRLYILPSLEIAWLQAVASLNWLLPQVKSAPSLIDDYLQSEIMVWRDLAPTLIQLPLLLALVLWLGRRPAAVVQPG